MSRRAMIGLGVVGFLAVVGTAFAATRFSDVDETHVQYRDIEYAVEQGWFFGYEDGTFKPDRSIPAHQLTTVIGRAFPEGATRADLATFLRGGSERLAALPSQSGSCESSATLDDPASPGCPAVSGDWTLVVHGAERSSWDRYADAEEGFVPITVSVTARYDGTDDVGAPWASTYLDLFIAGVGYDDGTACADDTYYSAPELLAGTSTTFTVCFAVPENSTGSGAYLRARGRSSESYNREYVWHNVVIP